jgi:bis(5'-nucleosyl)-tetraphosphatase (symmetrical)
VLRLWRDLGGRGLLGNHDIYALRAHAGREPRKGDTLDALFEAGDVETLLAHLREQPALVHLAGGDGVRAAWLVHAGLHPRWDDLDAVARRLDAAHPDDAWLTSPDVKFATRVRCCTAEGERCRHTGPPDACPPPHRPWDVFYAGPTLVVHGHWARRGAYRGPRTMGLDSGCVYGGWLTAWCQEENRLVQVPSRERGGSPRDFDASHLPAGSHDGVPGQSSPPKGSDPADRGRFPPRREASSKADPGPPDPGEEFEEL